MLVDVSFRTINFFRSFINLKTKTYHTTTTPNTSKPTSTMFSALTVRKFLLLAVILPYSSVEAFGPMKPPSSHSMDDLKAATVDDNDDIRSLISSVQSKIDFVEQKQGPLSDEAKDELIATALAGSVLGTAVGSPLLVGAALGYAGSQLLQGEKGEKTREILGNASKEMLAQANAALAFTKEQLEQEEDLSAASKKILLAIQEKAKKVENDFKNSPQEAMERLKVNLKKTVESEEFKTLPNRTFNAFRAFLESDEVKQASATAMKAIQDGLESEEMKALQSRASQAMKDTFDGKKNIKA
jgi:hypothetical protein